MPENLLYLSPVDINAIPTSLPTMLEVLRHEGFIGDRFTFSGKAHYRPGDKFTSFITFLGCSPVIAMEQSDTAGEGFSHIALEGPYESPKFVGGDNLKTPRCPECGHRFDDWQSLIEAWRQQPDTCAFSCPECSNQLTAPQLRWRKCGGFGRFFIKVWGIFESEAVPSPELLALLEKLSGCHWQHFYIRYRD